MEIFRNFRKYFLGNISTWWKYFHGNISMEIYPFGGNISMKIFFGWKYFHLFPRRHRSACRRRAESTIKYHVIYAFCRYFCDRHSVLRLGTCGTHMGILPESTDSLKTSYFSRESTFRMASVIFGGGGYSYALRFRID